MGSSPSKDLYAAARSGDLNGVLSALSRGADINYRNGSDSHTPLMTATKRGHVEVVRALLTRGAADLRAVSGNTALHYSAERNQPSCAVLLLDRGSDHFVRNALGQRPIDVAAQHGIVTMVRLLEARTCPFFADVEYERSGFLGLGKEWSTCWLVIHRALPWSNPAIPRGEVTALLYTSNQQARWHYCLRQPTLRFVNSVEGRPDLVVFELQSPMATINRGTPKAKTVKFRAAIHNYNWLQNVLGPDFPSGRGPSFNPSTGGLLIPTTAAAYAQTYATSNYTQPLMLPPAVPSASAAIHRPSMSALPQAVPSSSSSTAAASTAAAAGGFEARSAMPSAPPMHDPIPPAAMMAPQPQPMMQMQAQPQMQMPMQPAAVVPATAMTARERIRAARAARRAARGHNGFAESIDNAVEGLLGGILSIFDPPVPSSAANTAASATMYQPQQQTMMLTQGAGVAAVSAAAAGAGAAAVGASSSPAATAVPAPPAAYTPYTEEELEHMTFDSDPPSEFLCPITLELMVDPVILIGDGQSYSREAILTWLAQGKNRSPKTSAPFASAEDRRVIANYNLRSIIREWIEKHRVRPATATTATTAEAAAPAIAGAGAVAVASAPTAAEAEEVPSKVPSVAAAVAVPSSSAPSASAAARAPSPVAAAPPTAPPSLPVISAPVVVSGAGRASVPSGLSNHSYLSIPQQRQHQQQHHEDEEEEPSAVRQNSTAVVPPIVSTLLPSAASSATAVPLAPEALQAATVVEQQDDNQRDSVPRPLPALAPPPPGQVQPARGSVVSLPTDPVTAVAAAAASLARERGASNAITQAAATAPATANGSFDPSVMPAVPEHPIVAPTSAAPAAAAPSAGTPSAAQQQQRAPVVAL